MSSARVGAAQRWAPLLLPLALGAVVAAALSWRLGALGWGNQYYAAVAQSGAHSEWAFLEASPDLAAVTGTDKPPLAFWPMALAVRLLGLHGWAIALPQVLESTATVVVLGLLVRRAGGTVAAATAAAALACTPVFFVLARYDDPDTALTLCITVAAYAAVRACEAAASERWLAVLGVALGLAFLSKWLTAAVPAPALVGAVLWCRRAEGPGWWRPFVARPARRMLLRVLGPATAVGLAWPVASMLVPATRRPELDSPTDSLLDVILGQDGVGRFASAATGATTMSVRGAPGPLRLLTQPFAGQVGWLLPLAVLAGALAVVRLRRGAATSPAWLVLGGWLALAGAVLSVMGGPLHPYYSVLVAPPAAGIAGLTAGALWRRRRSLLAPGPWSAAVLAGVAVTGGYAALVLGAYPTLATGRWVVIAATATAFATLVALRAPRVARDRTLGPVLRSVAVLAAAASCLAGPTTFAASTLGHQVAGADPLAGPVPGSRPQEAYPTPLVSYLADHRRPGAWLAAAVTSTAASELQLQSRLPVLPLGGFTGHAAGPAVDRVAGWVASGRLRYLVLTGPYYRGLRTPPSLVGTPLATVMAWAATHGCPVATGTARYVVLDLTCRLPGGG